MIIACSTNRLNPICQSRSSRDNDYEDELLEASNSIPVDLVPQHSLLQTPASIENARRHNVPPFVYGNSIYYFYISDKASDGIFKQNFIKTRQSSPDEATNTNTPIQFTDIVNVQSPAILSKHLIQLILL